METNGNQNDVLDGGPGADILKAGGGDDTIFLDSADTLIDGGPGCDTGILTSPGNFTVHLGLKGLEAFISNNGNDTIGANPSAPAYIDGRGGGDDIAGSNFGDMLVGGTGNDRLVGAGGNDLLMGGADHDSLYGEEGDDVLLGGPGSDTIDGGNGNDTATFTGAAADYRRVSYNGHIYVFAANGERDDLTGVESLRFDDQTIAANTVPQAPPINPLEYIASYADLIVSFRPYQDRAERGQSHYLSNGIIEGRSATFDGLAYVASWTAGVGTAVPAATDGPAPNLKRPASKMMSPLAVAAMRRPRGTAAAAGRQP